MDENIMMEKMQKDYEAVFGKKPKNPKYIMVYCSCKKLKQYTDKLNLRNGGDLTDEDRKIFSIIL